MILTLTLSALTVSRGERRLFGGLDLTLRAGEVLARSNVVLEGYWEQPEATAQALHHGWYRTGDAGFLRAAIGAHTSPGLRMPWYAVVGNHDDSLLGTLGWGVLGAPLQRQRQRDHQSRGGAQEPASGCGDGHGSTVGVRRARRPSPARRSR